MASRDDGGATPPQGPTQDAFAFASGRRRDSASRVSPVVVALALLLFSIVLLGAALSFLGNFDKPSDAGRWLVSTTFLLVSIASVATLVRLVLPKRGSTPSGVPRGGPSGASAGQPEQGSAHAIWRFTPRWKEELVCTSSDGRLVVDMAMGQPNVYFPTDEAWARQAPDWARDRRAELLAELERWCLAQGVRLTVDDSAWIMLQ